MRHFERPDDPSFYTNLTPRGQSRSRELFIPGVTRIVSSPFPRCMSSVTPFADEIDVTIIIACALSEFIEDDRHKIGHETQSLMQSRVDAFIEADNIHRDECTLYVTHGAIAEYLTGDPFSVGDVRWVPDSQKDSKDSKDSKDTKDRFALRSSRPAEKDAKDRFALLTERRSSRPKVALIK